MNKWTAVVMIVWLSIIGLIAFEIARITPTVPALASHRVWVTTTRVAEDSCQYLVVDDYKPGLSGSFYHCLGPDLEVTNATGR